MTIQAYEAGHWTIIELINALKKLDPEWLVEVQVQMPAGIHEPRGLYSVSSYRGYYNCLGIEPGGAPLTVAHLIGMLANSIGSTFEGWKGGEYLMSRNTPTFIAQEGCTGPMVVGLKWIAGTNRVVVKTQEQDWGF